MPTERRFKRADAHFVGCATWLAGSVSPTGACGGAVAARITDEVSRELDAALKR
jgi:hypothetical protein